MNAEKVYKAIEEALTTFASGTDEYKIFSFKMRDLMDECKAEIAEKALAGSAKDVYKAALAFASKCRKKNWESRPQLSGAWIMDDGRQAICDGYTLVVYDRPLEALPTITFDKYSKPLDVKKIITCNYDAKAVLPEVQALKAALKTAKLAHTGKAKFEHYTKIETPHFNTTYWFNTELLIDAIELAGARDFEYCIGSSLNAIKIFGDNGFVLQMPIRKMPDDYDKGYVYKVAA